jgi:transposase
VRPGDLVILDDLSSHMTPAAAATLRRHQIDCQYKPPNSPNPNPIENALSKLKRLMPNAAERTADGMWGAIGRLIDQFRTAERRRCLRHYGYTATIN